MLARQRHDLILELVRRDGSVRVRDLAEQLDVSEMTVRRDLDALAAQHLVEKVHGGATQLSEMSSFEPGFLAKQERQRAEKDAIAEAALELIVANSAVGLTAGTTTWALARRMRQTSGVTVVTNSPSIAQTLDHGGRSAGSVVLTGGVRTPSDALVGPLALAALGRLHIDTLFLGVHGMDVGLGFSTPNLAEAEVDAAFIETAQRVVVLADHTKWGTRGFAHIAPLHAADVVISDRRLPVEARQALAELDVQLILAERLSEEPVDDDEIGDDEDDQIDLGDGPVRHSWA